MASFIGRASGNAAVGGRHRPPTGLARNYPAPTLSLRGAAGDEAISTRRATHGLRLLRFARNDSLRFHALRVGNADGELGGAELVPLLVHVAGLVHDRVPAGDLAETVCVGAAVAHGPGFLHRLAIGVGDDTVGGLALVPIAPFILAQELLGRFRNADIVALFRNEAAYPARLIPVEILIGGVALDPAEMPHQGEPIAPAAIALLERRVIARDAARAHFRHR